MTSDDTARCEKCEKHAIGVFDGELLCQMHASTRSARTGTEQ